MITDETVTGRAGRSPDSSARGFRLEREGAALAGHFMCHENAFFSLSEGWDPPPNDREQNPQWLMQYHLRFTVSGFARRRNLGVVLCPSALELPLAAVSTAREGALEVARLGGDTVAISGEGGPVEHAGRSGACVARLVLGGAVHEIGEAGIRLL